MHTIANKSKQLVSSQRHPKASFFEVREAFKSTLLLLYFRASIRANIAILSTSAVLRGRSGMTPGGASGGFCGELARLPRATRLASPLARARRATDAEPLINALVRTNEIPAKYDQKAKWQEQYTVD